MVFSSLEFLFLFLPLVLAGYHALPRQARNAWLLAASLLFYAWGEGWFVLVMVWTFLSNWALALLIERARSGRRAVLAAAVVLNLLLLLVFKYANLAVDSLAWCWSLAGGSPFSIPKVHLPIGISFFVFQAISYVVDVHRGAVRASASLLDFGMYKANFPQLIAGPIVRYKDVAHEIYERSESLPMFREGVQRFLVGLAKKVLIANTAATAADAAFATPAGELSCGLAWLGVVCYAIQIYFDFSAYSDMAIGLGRMLGFHFLENFNLPYIAASVQDFWHRWHISLSTWFRDYLYIPLGGSRCATWRVYANLATVFFLCGLWHGASWVFVVWGLWHGLFLCLERAFLGAWLRRLPRPVGHIYTILVVLVSWVLFRADQCPDSFAFALAYLKAMSGFAGGSGLHGVLTGEVLALGLAGCFFACNGGALIARAAGAMRSRAALAWIPVAAELLLVPGCLAVCTCALIGSGFNPFIYFRF